MRAIDAVLIGVTVIVVLNAIRIIAVNRKKGKSMCGGNCAGCMHSCGERRNTKK